MRISYKNYAVGDVVYSVYFSYDLDSRDPVFSALHELFQAGKLDEAKMLVTVLGGMVLAHKADSRP